MWLSQEASKRPHNTEPKKKGAATFVSHIHTHKFKTDVPIKVIVLDEESEQFH